MSKWRYTEIFRSQQCEGEWVGVNSVFLRLFGCNFRCKKFGDNTDKVFARSEPNSDVAKVISEIDNYANFNDLPIVTTGCDSYTSIYPEFKRFAQNKSTDDVVEELISLIHNQLWTNDKGQENHLIFTGGEPLLGWQKSFGELLNHQKMASLKNVTIETNGTQKLSKEFIEQISNTNTNSEHHIHYTFSCSPKLSVSGELRKDAIKPNIVKEYFDTATQFGNTDLYFKFVISDESAIAEVEEVVQQYNDAGIICPVYLMPCGGTYEEYIANSTKIALLALKYGYRYSPRLHVDLYKNAWGT